MKKVSARSAARPAARRSTVDPTRLFPSSKSLGNRPTVVGATVQYPLGTVLQLMGVNWGAWGFNTIPGDAADAKAKGYEIIRDVFRVNGPYSQAGTDSFDAQAFVNLNKANLNQFLAEVKSIAAQGIWVCVTLDSNCWQCGTQDAPTQAYCDSLGLWGTAGNNAFNNPAVQGLIIAIWKEIARELLTTPNIYCFEILAEPLPSGGLQNYDATWAPKVQAFYRAVIAGIRSVDKLTPFLLGPRGGYKMALIAEALLAERTDCMYTGDLLDAAVTTIGSIPSLLSGAIAFSVASTVPLFFQQVGRMSSNDPTLAAMHAILSALRAYGASFTWWENKQHDANPNGYSLQYPDGAGGWIQKANEIAALAYHMTESLATLEAAAQAAATAAAAVLFYVKSDLSNVFQDSAGTTHVTAVGQPIGLMNPVVGAGVTLLQATSAARPLLSQLVNRYGMSFDGATQYLSGSVAFFASLTDMTVIAAGVPASVASIQPMVQAGNATSTELYPLLGLSAAKVGIAEWEDDAANIGLCTGTTTLANFPVVLSGVDAAPNKSLFVNGIQEGATSTVAIGADATLNRLRVGANTVMSHFYGGSLSLVCICKAGMTAAQRQAIERFGAFLIAAPYQL